MTTMTTLAAVKILRDHNEWRRGGDDAVDVTELGIAIDTVVADVPEILEALQDLLDAQNGPPLIREKNLWARAMNKADAAIRKARGEEKSNA